MRPDVKTAYAATCSPILLLLATCAGWAQSYPVKPVRILIGFAPGGGADIVARGLTPRLVEALGQQVIVDNRPGANGLIAAELAAKAPPDGYTLLITSSSTHSINPHLLRKPLYDPLRDFAPVSLIASAPNLGIRLCRVLSCALRTPNETVW